MERKKVEKMERKKFSHDFVMFCKLCFCIARFLDNLLERDECSKEDGEGHETASPTIFTEACSNGNYVEVKHVSLTVLS